MLPDGRQLVQALAEAPYERARTRTTSPGTAPNPGLLVKLLDAGERLPVHSHPDRDFASRHLGVRARQDRGLAGGRECARRLACGSASARTPTPGCWPSWWRHRTTACLPPSNRVEVQRGDGILVPAGQCHAIGAGVLVVELQEPTDLSVMLEHERFGLDADHAWLGLDPELALESVATTALSPQDLADLRTRWDGADGLQAALPEETSAYFTAEVATSRSGPVRLARGFSVLVVVDGAGTLVTAAGDRTPLGVGEAPRLLMPRATSSSRAP